MLSRVEFVPCDRRDHYVLQVHVRPGDESEIYEDRQHKVSGAWPCLGHVGVGSVLVWEVLRCGCEGF